MAKIHYAKRTPDAFSATTSQAGFGPNNLGPEELDRPYRATSTGANDIVISLPVAAQVETLFLHDVNFAAAAIEKSADGVAFAAVGALNGYAGPEGRYRGAISVAAVVKALKVKISAGAALDGLAWWRIGAAYLFGSVATIPAPFQFPYRPRFFRPQVRADLANGREARARTGTGFHLIEVPFKPEDDESLQQLQTLTSSGNTPLLELGLANYPWQLWPVRLIDDEMDEVFSVPKVSDVTYRFREIV